MPVILSLLAIGVSRKFDLDVSERCFALNSAVAKRQLRVPAALSHEIVLSPQTIDAGVAKDLATALHGDLARDGDTGWRIYRGDETKRALAQADLDNLKSQLGQTVSRVRKLLDEYGAQPVETPARLLQMVASRFDPRPADQRLDTGGMEAQEGTPAARLLLGLLGQLSDRQIKSAAPGVVTVFSNQPFGWESPLTVSDEALSAYMSDQARFTAWTDDAIAKNKIPEKSRWLFPKEPFVAGPRTIRLSIGRFEAEATFSITVYDGQGRQEASALLSPRGFNVVPKGIPTPQKPLGRTPIDADLVRLPANDPLVAEPLDRFVRVALCGLAKAKGYEHAVGCVPDELYPEVLNCIKDSAIDLDAVDALLGRMGCEQIPSGRTLIVRPACALQEEAVRFDRAPASNLFQSAKRNVLTFDQICDYQAAHAGANSFNRLRSRVESSIRDAYDLSKFPGWSLPGPFLAVLGELNAEERKTLVAGAPIRLSPSPRTAGRYGLAELVGALGDTGSDLDRTPTRIFAGNSGARLTEAAKEFTLVKRVSRRYARQVVAFPAPGEPSIREGINLVIDRTFVGFEGILNPTMPREDALADLDKDYRFYWSRDRFLTFRITFAKGPAWGPYTVQFPLEQSSSIVPLSEVPGVNLPPKP